MTPSERKVTIDEGSGERLGLEFVQRLLTEQNLRPLDAVGLARGVAEGAEEGLAMMVTSARAAGHTWAEIGTVLGTSRQAAFQRFGRPSDPRTGKPLADSALAGAGEWTIALFAELSSGHWARVHRRFDATMAERLNQEKLAELWARLVGMIGECERHSTPRTHQAGDYTVVDLPLYFEAGERTLRISYDSSGAVAGLFFLATEGESR